MALAMNVVMRKMNSPKSVMLRTGLNCSASRLRARRMQAIVSRSVTKVSVSKMRNCMVMLSSRP